MSAFGTDDSAERKRDEKSEPKGDPETSGFVARESGDARRMPARGPPYKPSPNSPCLNCSSSGDAKTAEVLYTSAIWDFYYCYRCKGWFKTHYKDGKAIIPIRDRALIKRLTWFYTSHLEMAYEQQRFLDVIASFWHGLERHLFHYR